MVTHPLVPTVSAFIVVLFILVSGYIDIASASLKDGQTVGQRIGKLSGEFVIEQAQKTLKDG